MRKLLYGCMGLCLSAGCMSSDTARPLGLDYAAMQTVAGKMLDSLMASGALARNDGKRHVLAISRVKNETTQDIDVKSLTSMVSEKLINEVRNLTVTMAEAYDVEDGVDPMVNAYTPATYNLTWSGVVREKRTPLSNGQTQVEYFFDMTVADRKLGVAIWKKTELITQTRTSGAGMAQRVSGSGAWLVTDIPENRTPGGLKKVGVKLENTTSAARRVDLVCNWLDRASIEVSAVKQELRDITLPARAIQHEWFIAPNERAVEYSIVVDARRSKE